MSKTALLMILSCSFVGGISLQAKETPLLPLFTKGKKSAPLLSITTPSPSSSTHTPPPFFDKEPKKESHLPSCNDPKTCQIGHGVTIQGSYLLWKGSENLSPYGQVVTKENIINPEQGIGSPRGHNQPIHFEWASGFTVGMGYSTDYDCWDLGGNWTWYRNDTHNQITSQTNGPDVNPVGLAGTENGLGIYNNWGKVWAPANFEELRSGLPVPILLEGPFSTASIRWKLDYDTFDFQLGKSFKTKGNLLRPFFGVQGALIERTLSAAYTGYANPGSLTSPGVGIGDPVFTIDGFASAYNKAKMNFWGVGPLLGVVDALNLPYGFTLFGQLGLSMFYGKTYGYDQNSLIGSASEGGGGTVTESSLYDGNKWNRHNISSFATHLQMNLGIGWSLCFNKQRSQFFLSAGWEEHLWFFNNYSSAYNTGNMNLSLGGLTATGGFKF